MSLRSRAPVNGQADVGLDQTVLAIGHRIFPETLLASLRQIADVDHCAVFAFKNDRYAKCLLSIGNIAIGQSLRDEYVGHFHKSDPNKSALLGYPRASAPILLPYFRRENYERRYQDTFFERPGIVDKFASAIWHNGTCYYTNFYRTRASGHYTTNAILTLQRLSSSFVAAIARHYTPFAGRDPASTLSVLFETTDPLNHLSKREKEVCTCILLGLSSQAIATSLGVSLHSIVTYRRRSYERLGISSQNELFALVLGLYAREGAAGALVDQGAHSDS